MNTRRGLTLVELLAALAILTMIVVSVSASWEAANRYRQNSRASREEHEHSIRFERQISALLRSAYISASHADTSYFITLDQETESSSPAPGIVFTSAGTRAPAGYLEADDELDVLNNRFGPQGGLTEVALSTTPVGDPGDKSGLFLREQRPPDGDHEQGGYEQAIDEEVQSIGFEFYDGVAWVTSWDSRRGGNRLPAAVRVHYQLAGEDERSFDVQIPASDVTPANPFDTAGATG